MDSVLTADRARPLSRALPWPLVVAVFGASAMLIGLLWDISWHATIGRDSFWTPPHLAIHLGGLLCGLTAGWLACAITFGHDPAGRDHSVRFWGFQAPYGAWITIWGAFAMLTSAPFDNWWHDAYGLDVKIVSPPHIVLALGVHAVLLGVMVQAASTQNRAGGGNDHRQALLFAYTGGLLLLAANTLLLEFSAPNLQHGGLFFEVSAATYPLFLVAVGRAGRLRWPATTAATAFTLLKLGLVWILPLFPAEPRLAPIYNPVHHFWPPMFPLLLVLPALAIDLLLQRLGDRAAGITGWLVAALASVLFLIVFIPSQWLFADFMLSAWSRNPLFAGDEWTYLAHLGPRRYEFWSRHDELRAGSLAIAATAGLLACRCGLALGGWLRRVQR